MSTRPSSVVLAHKANFKVGTALALCCGAPSTPPCTQWGKFLRGTLFTQGQVLAEGEHHLWARKGPLRTHVRRSVDYGRSLDRLHAPGPTRTLTAEALRFPRECMAHRPPGPGVLGTTAKANPCSSCWLVVVGMCNRKCNDVTR